MSLAVQEIIILKKHKAFENCGEVKFKIKKIGISISY